MRPWVVSGTEGAYKGSPFKGPYLRTYPKNAGIAPRPQKGTNTEDLVAVAFRSAYYHAEP